MEPKTENLGEEILCRLILEENLCGDILENLRGDMKTLNWESFCGKLLKDIYEDILERSLWRYIRKSTRRYENF